MSFITVISTDGETTSWDNSEVLGVHEGNLWISENLGESEDMPGTSKMQAYGIPLGEIVNLMVEEENGYKGGDLNFEDSTLYHSLSASGVIED